MSPQANILLDRALRQSVASLTIVDPQLIIRYCYNCSEGHTEAAHAVIGRSVLDMVPAAQRDELAKLYARVLAGERVSDLQECTNNKAGTTKVLREIYPIYGEHGAVLGVATSNRLLGGAEWFIDKPEVPMVPHPIAPHTLKSPSAEKLPMYDQARLDKLEKEAMLGRLVAGIAHELNTPVGAVSAGASNLMDIYEELLPMISKTLGGEHQKTWAYFQRSMHALSQAQVIMSSKEKRRATRVLEDKLQVISEDPHEIAQRMVTLGLQDELDVFLPLLLLPTGYKLFEIVERIGLIRMNASNINLASTKAQKLVRALRDYNTAGIPNDPQALSIADSLETTLQIFHNELKYGVEVEAAIDDSLEVLGNKDMLYQLWSNLIQNALDAMERSGQLTILAMATNGQAIVSIADNGPGIPEAIQDSIFKRGASTKAKGQGIGLALCKAAAQELGGHITFSSEPGNTVFTVRLPLVNHKQEAA